MDSDVPRVVDVVRAGGLLAADRPVTVLLSGGRDSVCLLDVAVRVAGAASVRALHVNYGLRTAAGDDERSCRELCDALGVELTVERAGAAPETGNLQAWARDLRYGVAARHALEGGGRVATGHTATDQAETILYRLAASPGRRALLGMREHDGRLVRPLLSVTRAETTAYCQARGLTWRDDETNDSDLYTRARVRNDLVPALRELHPAAEANVVRTAELLRQEGEVLDALVDDVLGGRDRVAAARLGSLPPALARLVVRRLAEDTAGRLSPDAAARAQEIAELGARGHARAAIDLEGGLQAVWEAGELRFAMRPETGLSEPPRRGSVAL